MVVVYVLFVREAAHLISAPGGDTFF